MTIVAIEFTRAGREALFLDERLHTIQYLLGQGCYGPLIELQSNTLWDLLSPSFEDSRRIEIADGQSLPDRIEQEARRLSFSEMTFLEVQLPAESPAELAAGDEALGSLMARLNPDDVLALVAGALPDRAYLIVAASLTVQGPSRPTTVSDLALTLLALAGSARPNRIQGDALLQGERERPLSDDEELRERFRGLGYIG